ncbi:MAG: glycosyl hydrolase [Rhodothermaceae bacterium]|nr:MAG: glycosyl hydrolase [Rhodothermaceae bacterium]
MKTLLFAFFAVVLVGCGDGEAPETAGEHTAHGAADTTGEHAAHATADTAWIALFDGTSTDHWRGYRKDHLPDAWQIEDGTLAFVPGSGEGGDIITKEQFEDFELELEWKVAEGGNSGIMYLVVESEEYDYPWQTGPEMQILDNAAHADAQIEKHRAGDLYDLIAGSEDASKPAGAWNHVRIVLHDGHLEHWLNGKKVVETRLWTPAWDSLVAASKFRDMEGFGQARRGHIALQDHGDRVWFRNIRIRRL